MTVDSLDTDGPAIITHLTASNRTIRDSGADHRVSMAVIQAVEAATGIDALDLPPLHDTVDPDALDALVRSADQPFRVTFDYAGVVVAIDDVGEISLTVPDGS